MLTITSNSLDELNQLYRQLKHSYVAHGKIQLNTESLMYQMDLEKIAINPVVRNLSEKTFEWMVSDFESSELSDVQEFFDILQKQGSIPFIRQLLEQMNQMKPQQQLQVLSYFRELRHTTAADINLI